MFSTFDQPNTAPFSVTISGLNEDYDGLTRFRSKTNFLMTSGVWGESSTKLNTGKKIST